VGVGRRNGHDAQDTLSNQAWKSQKFLFTASIANRNRLFMSLYDWDEVR
jgi:hypothetical protein